MSNVAAVQQSYASSTAAVRPSFGSGDGHAEAYYARYVAFVLAHAPITPSRILDVGCGTGWSTLMFHRAGHQAHGVDLHQNGLEAWQEYPDLPYTSADAQALPFPANSFDVVSMYQMLEHVPNPERALEEAIRVLRPGGRLVVVGPNLIGAGYNLYWALRHTARCLRQGKIWETRLPGMPHHPGGNTMPEAWLSTTKHLAWTLKKMLIEKHPQFLTREPDLEPPFQADNDACYYCTPLDLLNWGQATGVARPVRWWATDRRFARLIWPFTSGTWVVLEKK
ncbi:MAG: class I SAM-dependent methyltransferase [Myxococcales bacterium]